MRVDRRIYDPASLAAICGSILICCTCCTVICAPPVLAEAITADQGRSIPGPGTVLSERQRIEPVNRMLRARLDDLLPALMREAEIDLWLVINREYAEDPVYLTLVPDPVFAARRTTMLVFHDRGTGAGGEDRGVERLTVSRYGLGELYESAWEGGDLDEQWSRLAEIVAERDPRRIGIDVSRHWPVADGLTASLNDRLLEALGPRLSQRVVSAEELVIRWVETRGAEELEVYPHVVSLARGVISEAFSERVITPGVTTTEDVAWFIRERFGELGLPVWFMPYVNAQRPGGPCEAEASFCGEPGAIRRGDVLHTDVGICYLRLCTDTQEMGYVLRPGETGVPDGLERALATGNRWQDLLTTEMVTGRTGNEILAAARAAAEGEGIASSVYTHPLGFFGHAPGPTIGMWDNQGPTPVRGDWKLHPDTAYAIEGNVKVPVAEWDGQHVQIKLEQSAVFDGERVLYLAGRQTAWHLVR
ncbi:MAG: M24 family metallopeptidase [bacterium]|nr:M24 family metallopeptidase [bacterium]